MKRCATDVRLWPFRWFLVLLVLAVWVGVTYAQESPQVVRVEEDWELVVDCPDPERVGPQVVCVISPVCNVDSVYAAFELNAQSLPSFAPGGLQLQIWNGKWPVSDKKHPSNVLLWQAGETIRWTQSMELEGGILHFEITNGESIAWGSFGGQGLLKASVDTQLTDLHLYDPAVSIANSGIGYADNRVQSLKLLRFRVYLSTGEFYEEIIDGVVHQQD